MPDTTLITGQFLLADGSVPQAAQLHLRRSGIDVSTGAVVLAELSPVTLEDGEAPEGWGLIPNSDGIAGTVYSGQLRHRRAERLVTEDLPRFQVPAAASVSWAVLFTEYLADAGSWVPQARMPDGTAAAPGLAFSDDPDTGFYRPGPNQVGLSLGGASAGDVVGTTQAQTLTNKTLTNPVVNGLMTGTAVVSSDSDVTAGRLLTTEAGPAQAFRRGNILGTVSQSGGVPTGAVIERGSNANGDYVRFADGTQICTHTANFGSVTNEGSGTFADPYKTGAFTWIFPAVFSEVPVMSGTTTVEDGYSLRSAIYLVHRNDFLPTRATVMAFRATTHPAADIVTGRLMAVGRWF